MKHNTLILAHLYQDGEIQDLADHVGDSLYLAQQGQKSKASTVLMAGVVFMAESVKLLSPEKEVLAPDLRASCSLVDHSPYEKYRDWRRQFPDHLCVSYVNSSAKVKALSDVIVTSSNAEKIIRAIPGNRQILFGPDRHLGRYLSQRTGRSMKLWPGSCEVHVLFSARELFHLKQEHPEAPILAHPECTEAVLAQADVVGSTSRLLEEVKSSLATKFIVATEAGILHQMKRARPQAEFFPAPSSASCSCNECPYMKMNTLEKIAVSLQTRAPRIEIDPALAERARLPLERMMALTEDKKVTWPERFDDQVL